ncbi:MAG: SUMF1/EgtB/PvdO family nonheme iron enzyme [Bacteroidales bacterium]|jgi:formylglycine-generating enzyme required for sulfatase activity|nr:SUMF1/EgtB/PvdO family nonheme iron enzyme [Bacteroidales bacterium]
MKKYLMVLFTVFVFSSIFWSCGSDDNTSEPTNHPPTCSITTPANYSGFLSGDTITVKVNAEDPDGDIKEVRFFLDSVGVASVQVFPYNAEIETKDLIAGSHIIKIVAEDDAGAETEISLPFGIKPKTPTNLQLTQNNVYTYSLNWTDNSNDEQGFKIERKIDDGVYSEIAITTSNTFIDSTISKKGLGSVYYQVKSFADIYNSDYASNSYAINFPAPYNLTYTKVNITTIKLDWLETSNGEDGFKIDKKVGVSDWIIGYATVGENIKTWTDSIAEINESLQFKVYGYKGLNTSGSIETAVISNQFPAPTNLNITQTSLTTATITFTDNCKGEDKFEIERKLSTETTYTTIANISGSDTSSKSWIDSTTVPNLIYDYRVRGVKDSDASLYVSKLDFFNEFKAPINLNYSRLAYNDIKLDWSEFNDGEHGFKIDLKIGTSEWILNYIILGENITNWIEQDIDTSETYYFRVSSYYDNINSPLSEIIEIYPVPDNMIFIEGSTYNMGDIYEEGSTTEIPVHQVQLSNFYLSNTELTQGAWAEYMPGKNYDAGIGTLYPVYYITWYEIIKYCNLRSIAEDLDPCYTIANSTDPSEWGEVPTSSNGTWNSVICNWDTNGYRLPTEAEWEYAARGGIYCDDNFRFSGSNTLDSIAWCSYNSGESSHEVAKKIPNQLDLYDMTGNVLEMCWDFYDSNYYQYCFNLGIVNNPHGPSIISSRIMRGGLWSNDEFWSRVASRSALGPTSYGKGPSCRIARTK